ncbi:MAG: TatD family hydrolase [Patescibacteria group bacterium]|nr:TatD family hydrolase [Patescibacteria group bacterium]
MTLIDTHAHLNFNAFSKDREKIIEKSLQNNLEIINVGINYQTSQRAVEIAEQHNTGIYATIGLHPIHLKNGFIKLKTDPEEGDFIVKGENFDKEKYRQLAQSKKVVAIGEIGLDYYYVPKKEKELELLKQKQKQILLEQIEFARELDLPIIFHCRKAHQDLLKILKLQRVRGVIHCFTGKWKEAQEYLEMGFYLGFNGIIFKLNLDKIIKKVPLEKILIETDSPYLTPPQVKIERNEPLFVKYVAEKIAEIKEVNYEKVAEITTKNAQNLFQI